MAIRAGPRSYSKFNDVRVRIHLWPISHHLERPQTTEPRYYRLVKLSRDTRLAINLSLRVFQEYHWIYLKLICTIGCYNIEAWVRRVDGVVMDNGTYRILLIDS